MNTIYCLNWVGDRSYCSWVAVVTPTDRPKSVRNRCVIELFVTLYMLSLCPFDISVGVGAFVIGLSQISSFFSVNNVFDYNLQWWLSTFFQHQPTFLEQSLCWHIKNQKKKITKKDNSNVTRSSPPLKAQHVYCIQKV